MTCRRYTSVACGWVDFVLCYPPANSGLVVVQSSLIFLCSSFPLMVDRRNWFETPSKGVIFHFLPCMQRLSNERIWCEWITPLSCALHRCDQQQVSPLTETMHTVSILFEHTEYLLLWHSRELLHLMQAGTLEPETAFLNASLVSFI